MGSVVDTVKENPLLLAIPAAAVAGPALFPALAGGAGAAGSITGGLAAGSLAPVTPATMAAVGAGASPAAGIGGLSGLMQLTRSPMGHKLLSPEGLQQAQNLFGGEEDQQALPRWSPPHSGLMRHFRREHC